MLFTIAGNGSPGWTGTGGPATAVAINRPYNVFFEHSTGNIYFTPAEGARMVNASGIIVDVAGSGVNGYTGDGGPATAALLREPRGITRDAAGNIFIADNQNYVIRKINSAGIITTFAGTNTLGYSGEGGPASAASLAGIASIRFEQGNLYLAVAGYNRICKIDAAGIVTTVAGTGAAGFSGDGGPATAANFNLPFRITFDNWGDMYISDNGNGCIRMIDTTGIVTLKAGNGVNGYGGDGGPAIAGQIWEPNGLAFDKHGNYLIADWGNSRIRKVTPKPDKNHTTFDPLLSPGTDISILAFPNPNNGAFSINIQTAQREEASVIITGMDGRVVKNMVVQTNSTADVGLDGHIPVGIYLLTAYTNEGKFTKLVNIQ